MDYGSLENSVFLDVFSELGNIGAGNATTALSQMLNRPINLTVPAAKFVDFKEITGIVGSPESVVVSGLIEIKGDLNGFVLLVLSEDDAAAIVQSLLGEEEPAGSALEFDEMQTSVVLEVTNILIGAYVTAINQLTGLNVILNPPRLAIDMAAAIMSVPAVEYGKMGDTVLFIKTSFIDKDRSISGHFFLVPDYESTNKMLGALGIEIG